MYVICLKSYITYKILLKQKGIYLNFFTRAMPMAIATNIRAILTPIKESVTGSEKLGIYYTLTS